MKAEEKIESSLLSKIYDSKNEYLSHFETRNKLKQAADFLFSINPENGISYFIKAKIELYETKNKENKKLDLCQEHFEKVLTKLDIGSYEYTNALGELIDINYKKCNFKDSAELGLIKLELQLMGAKEELEDHIEEYFEYLKMYERIEHNLKPKIDAMRKNNSLGFYSESMDKYYN